MNRIILHLDMDYFFGQIEERENPRFKGQPVVVGADPKKGFGRGVVSTCNYEARKFGIHSAMPISQAYRACPSAIFLPVDGRLYSKVSREIMSWLRQNSSKFEQVSIDEAYINITQEVAGNFKKAKIIAEKIKRHILKEQKLTCSVGLAPNKLVSKIAANQQKPDGLTIVEPQEVEKFLEPMMVEVLPGIGPKTKAKLNRLKIYKIKDLRKLNQARLVELFGKNGKGISQMSRGIDEREVQELKEIKSLSRHHTFEQDRFEPQIIIEKLNHLIKRIHDDLREEGLLFRTITLTVRNSKFQTFQKSHTLPRTTTELALIKNYCLKMLLPYLDKKTKIRLIAVKLSKLT